MHLIINSFPESFIGIQETVLGIVTVLVGTMKIFIMGLIVLIQNTMIITLVMDPPKKRLAHLQNVQISL